MFNHGFRAVTSPEHLETALTISNRRPVVIFKHSTRCGVSAEALEVLTATMADLGGDIEVWVITVPAQREMSNQVAIRLGVRHESPQLIVLRDGAVAWHASHFRLTSSAIEAALGEPAAVGS
jgi:bacillithiol system protein YtxJ